MQMLLFIQILGSVFLFMTAYGQIYLKADGITDTYNLINSVLLERNGNVVEVPDCEHIQFGKHITQEFDLELSRFVFVFHAHTNVDHDRCINYDRSRTEIKTYEPSPPYLKANRGDTCSFSWNFKLEPGFEPSNSFTHLHQIKVVGGDESMPTITLTALRGNNGNPNYIQLINVDSYGKTTRLMSSNIEPFLNEWVHVNELLTYDTKGYFSFNLTRVKDGATLLSFKKNNIDLWRNETSFSRPKWGIYRSLTNPNVIRNETVKFDTFCLAKGIDRCT